MRHAPLQAVVLLTLVGCGPSESGIDGTHNRPIGVSRVPLPDFDVDSSVDAIDFAIDEEHDLHVVWRATVHDKDKPWIKRYETGYARGERGGASWTAPILLERERGETPHVLLIDDEVHVFFGSELRHFISMDDGRSWKELPKLIPGDQAGAMSFDAVGIDDTVVAAYIGPLSVDPSRSDTAANRSLGLNVVRWSNGEISSPMLLGQMVGSIVAIPSPRLAVAGRQLDLVCALNQEARTYEQVRGKPSESFEVSGHLYYFRSMDAGDSWSPPMEICREGGGTPVPAPCQAAPSIDAVDILRLSGRLLVFYSASGVYFTASENHCDWSAARQVARYGTALSGSHESSSVSAVAQVRGGKLFWIDARFRRSNRSFFNPLGGFPWSDAPDWRNNDVFSLPISAMLQSGTRRAPPDPERLTWPMSFARAVRARSDGTRVYVVWAGRERVGRELTSYGARPEIFYATLNAQ